MDRSSSTLSSSSSSRVAITSYSKHTMQMSGLHRSNSRIGATIQSQTNSTRNNYLQFLRFLCLRGCNSQRRYTACSSLMPCFICGEYHQDPNWFELPVMSIQNFSWDEMHKLHWEARDNKWYFFFCSDCSRIHEIINPFHWFINLA